MQVEVIDRYYEEAVGSCNPRNACPDPPTKEELVERVSRYYWQLREAMWHENGEYDAVERLYEHNEPLPTCVADELEEYCDREAKKHPCLDRVDKHNPTMAARIVHDCGWGYKRQKTDCDSP